MQNTFEDLIQWVFTAAIILCRFTEFVLFNTV